MLVADPANSVYTIWTDPSTLETFAIVKVADSNGEFGVVSIDTQQQVLSAILFDATFAFVANQVHVSFDESSRCVLVAFACSALVWA